MKVGDELKIKGYLGFLWNPTMVVLEKKGSLVRIISKDAKEGGLLSHLNYSWHGINLLESKIKMYEKEKV